MADTPEKKVKAKIKGLLSEYKLVYVNWPVPAGYGTPMLDVVGCHKGLFFAIEAKAKGKKPTPRQRLCIEQMQEAGGAVFVIDGEPGLNELKRWLDGLDSSANKRGTQSDSDPG